MLSRFISLRSRAGLFSRSILLCMGLFDELITGFPVIALPLLRDRLGLSYTQVGLLFTAGALSAMLIEPLLNLFSDRGSKKPWILGGLLLFAAAFAVMGNVTSYVVMLLTFM